MSEGNQNTVLESGLVNLYSVHREGQPTNHNRVGNVADIYVVSERIARRCEVSTIRDSDVYLVATHLVHCTNLLTI